MPRLDIQSVVVESGMAMFLVSCALGIGASGPSDEGGWARYAVLASIPATAALGYLLVAHLIPALTAPGRLGFPRNLTLPAVYSSFVAVGLVLWSLDGNGLEAVPEVLKPALVWTQPRVMLAVYVANVAVLTALGWVQRSGGAER